MRNEKIKISKKCPACGRTTEKSVDKKCYDDWQAGTVIQVAFPDMIPFMREWMITGHCYDCISRIFHVPKPGEDWGLVVAECRVCGTSMYKRDKGICPTCHEDNNAEEEE